MTAPVQLVFLGEVIEGFAIDDVKRTLGDIAVELALATCTANRKPHTPECAPVNVDGEWGAFQPE